MSESTPFMFTQAIQPSDSTKFVRGVAELAREKQRKALMDLERAKQNASQIANATAGYKIDAIPEAWRPAWNNYLTTKKAEITEKYSSNDQEEYQEAVDGLISLTNLYTTLTTATPDSVASNIQTLKNLSDPAFRNNYDRNLGIFNEVDDTDLPKQVADAEFGLENPFGEDYTFKIDDNGQPMWVGPDGDTKFMNDYTTILSSTAQNYGPRINTVSPYDISDLSTMVMEEMQKAKKDWNSEDAKTKVDRYMKGGASTDKKKIFKHAVIARIEDLEPEEKDMIMNGDWENDEYLAGRVNEAIDEIVEGSEYGSETTTTTTTTETPADDPSSPDAPQ